MRRKNRTFSKILLGIIFFAFLLGSLGWVYRSNLLTLNLDVVQAKSGGIEHKEKIRAVFANEEVLIQGTAFGNPEFSGKEGQRFRRGDTVAVMKSQGVNLEPKKNQDMPVKAPQGGILYYTTDGLETIITPENLVTMNLGKVIEQTTKTNTTENESNTNSVIGKIVNNLTPTAAFIQLPPNKEIKIGESLSFHINGQAYKGKVLRISEEPQGVVVQFEQYIDGTSKTRVQEITWNRKPVKDGIVLPQQVVWTMGEEQGVYIVMRGRIQFKNVQPIDENGEFVCFSEEDIPIGIPVILNPRAGLDGLSIKM